MKRILVGDGREEILSTLEVILKHWGYRVSLSSRPQQVLDFLQETAPDLLVIDRRMLADPASPLAAAVSAAVAGGAPLIVLDGAEGAPCTELPHETLDVPLDVFALFAIIQRHVEKQPRQNLRLAVKLPGMFCNGKGCQLGEVLSLSAHGLFIKTGARLRDRDALRVTFPLMGMKRELEIDGRVCYLVEPGPENNYLQGAGIEFLPMDRKTELELKRFIECCFLGEISASQRGTEGLSSDQIQNIAPELILRLTPPD